MDMEKEDGGSAMRIDFFSYADCVILCNGAFPEHEIPLQILRNAKTIICCDGAISKLDVHSIEPTVIVGDLDSISEEFKKRYAHRIFHNPDQETNDLTKSAQWAKEHGYERITILGATGLREDHTLGNISLLTEYQDTFSFVNMVTDTGVFTPMANTQTFPSFVGQQVSLFTIDQQIEFSSENLRYPLPRHLRSWWCGTLNESMADEFTIRMTAGRVIVFQEFNHTSTSCRNVSQN